jgi:hypothetical protein
MGQHTRQIQSEKLQKIKNQTKIKIQTGGKAKTKASFSTQ